MAPEHGAADLDGERLLGEAPPGADAVGDGRTQEPLHQPLGALLVDGRVEEAAGARGGRRPARRRRRGAPVERGEEPVDEVAEGRPAPGGRRRRRGAGRGHDCLGPPAQTPLVLQVEAPPADREGRQRGEGQAPAGDGVRLGAGGRRGGRPQPWSGGARAAAAARRLRGGDRALDQGDPPAARVLGHPRGVHPEGLAQDLERRVLDVAARGRAADDSQVALGPGGRHVGHAALLGGVGGLRGLAQLLVAEREAGRPRRGRPGSRRSRRARRGPWGRRAAGRGRRRPSPRPGTPGP